MENLKDIENMIINNYPWDGMEFYFINFNNYGIRQQGSRGTINESPIIKILLDKWYWEQREKLTPEDIKDELEQLKYLQS